MLATISVDILDLGHPDISIKIKCFIFKLHVRTPTHTVAIEFLKSISISFRIEPVKLIIFCERRTAPQ